MKKCIACGGGIYRLDNDKAERCCICETADDNAPLITWAEDLVGRKLGRVELAQLCGIVGGGKPGYAPGDC